MTEQLRRAPVDEAETVVDPLLYELENERLAANYEATKLVMDAFFADKDQPEEIQF